MCVHVFMCVRARVCVVVRLRGLRQVGSTSVLGKGVVRSWQYVGSSDAKQIRASVKTISGCRDFFSQIGWQVGETNFVRGVDSFINIMLNI